MAVFVECPKCGANDWVTLESRTVERLFNRGGAHHPTIRRRRSCCQCNHRLTTYEVTKTCLQENILGLAALGDISKLAQQIQEEVKKWQLKD